jgi:hypothetical protein
MLHGSRILSSQLMLFARHKSATCLNFSDIHVYYFIYGVHIITSIIKNMCPLKFHFNCLGHIDSIIPGLLMMLFIPHKSHIAKLKCLMITNIKSSQNHIATDGQSVSKSWCQAPSGSHDLLLSWQLRSCICGAPSLTRGRFCLLYMLLALASAVFLWSESLGTRDHVLLSQIWDFSTPL